MAINSVFRERHKKIHLVGIGGIGMSGIARILLESGFFVSGSDLVESSETENLRALGAEVFIGHHPDNIRKADIVVFSSAIRKDNPELLMADALKIPIIPRAIMLAELMRLRCGIAVSGAHGKTTTTSLIGFLMHKLGLDPTVIIGGIVNHFASNAVLGKSQYMVAEADESDGTFLSLSPTIAVVTNIDAEHLDFYRGGIDEIAQNFTTFLNALPFYGLAVISADDANITKILPYINRRLTTYGFKDDAVYQAKDIANHRSHTEFNLYVKNRFVDRFVINMVGDHNVLNALAAIAVLEEIGIMSPRIKPVLKEFNGIKRRFTKISDSDDFVVIDDYAHHPTEIKAVLSAARSSFPEQRIRVLFQPHRYSRTKDLMVEFSQCFDECDSLVVSEIYGAQENPIPGIDARALVQNINSHKKISAISVTDLDEGIRKIIDLSDKNNIVLTLGAGSITKTAPIINDLLLKKFNSI